MNGRFVDSAHRSWTRVLATLRRVGRRRVRASLLLGLLGLSGSVVLGLAQGVPLPSVHDEFSYLLGADTFSEGRLANPTHPHWQHFETFHVIQKPTYASKYPPGQAILLGLGQRLGGHPVVGLWLGSGLLAAALTWALLIWLPSHWGLLVGGFATVQLTWFSYWAQSYWGGAVAAVGGALAIGALRVIWRQPRLGHAVILGIGLVLMSISRPFEGALVGFIIGGALLWRMVASEIFTRRRLFVNGLLPAAAVVALGLAWQGYYNLKVTESPWTMPYQVDRQHYAANPTFLFRSPGPVPDYRHREMERYWLEWGRARHEQQRELVNILTTVPSKLTRLLFFFLGPGVIAIAGIRVRKSSGWTRLSFVGLGLVVGASLFTKGTFPHYIAPVTLWFLVVMGVGMAGLHRRARKKGTVNVAMATFVALAMSVCIAIGAFLTADHDSFAQDRHGMLSTLQERPGKHLVVVTYGPQHNYHEEWVYNRADIDGAQVVWARSIDPAKDRMLIEHFSDRSIWLLYVDDDWDLQPHPQAWKEPPPRSQQQVRPGSPVQMSRQPGSIGNRRSPGAFSSRGVLPSSLVISNRRRVAGPERLN